MNKYSIGNIVYYIDPIEVKIATSVVKSVEKWTDDSWYYILENGDGAGEGYFYPSVDELIESLKATYYNSIVNEEV